MTNPTPLYEQIAADIRRRIKLGELLPGERVGSRQELAEKYGVSLITVKGALSVLVSEGILYSRVGKGTYVSERPEVKVDRSAERIIGLVLRDLKHPYFSLFLHSIEERAYELGYHVLLSSSSEDPEKEESQIERFRKLGVEGLIIASLSFKYRATEPIQRLHKEHFPYVMISYIHDPDYWYVGSDHELGGFMATAHLIQIGYRSIAYAHIGRRNLLSEVRKNGYSRALAEYDLPPSSELVFSLEPDAVDAGVDRFRLGYEFGKRFAGMERKPEALFCYNDLLAVGFVRGVHDSGLKVPDDVAVVGFDDSPPAWYASVPITTIRQPVDRLGRSAVDVLQNRISGKETPHRIILKPTLVIRESCGARKRSLIDQPISASPV